VAVFLNILLTGCLHIRPHNTSTIVTNIKIGLYIIVAMNTTQPYQVRTHTYWMTVKEYVKWSKTRQPEIPFNNNTNMKIRRRTHINFV
jgi:hypothetical protein